MSHLVHWETRTSLGRVMAIAKAEPPEPEVGFRGGYSIQKAILLSTYEDVVDRLPIEDKWELQIQAGEVADESMPTASLPRPR